MAGKATGKPAWSADELATVGAFMESWNNEGYASTSGPSLLRAELSAEASGWPGWSTAECPTTVKSSGCWR
jgi:hypothetical protein